MFQLVPIIFENFMFWFNFIIIIAITIYIFFTNRSEYVPKEFAIQIFGTFLLLVISYLVIFTTTTDLLQSEFWGGKVTKAVYEEKWTEEYNCDETVCTGSGKNERCRTVHKTCYTYHPDEFYIISSNNTKLNMNETNWKTYQKEFGASETKVHRSGQTTTSKLLGEGDIWNCYPNIEIPVAEVHDYINYIVASKMTIRKSFKSELTEDDKKGLFNYPQLESNKYGRIALNRIIGNVDQKIKNELQLGLDKISIKYAKDKQVNVFLYVLNNKDRSFIPKIESNLKFNKNDAILLLNVVDDKISWSDSINFLSGEEFSVSSKNGFDNLELNNTKEILTKYEDLIKNDWKRVSMKNFEYLKGDVDIDVKWQLLVILINSLFNFFVFKYFLRNRKF